MMIAGAVALLTPGFYAAETINWQVQSRGQDLVDLFLILPCLIVSSILVFRNQRGFMMIWGGIALYLTYTFFIFCFDVHFNSLFVVYCLCLGLSFYTFLYSVVVQYNKMLPVSLERNWVHRVIAVYLIVVAILFYFLWLSEIIPAIIQKRIPRSVADAGLFTNGVHVLDLSLLLPGIFITGVLLLKKVQLGILLAPVLLVFFFLMDITIGFLVVLMKMNGLADNAGVAAVMAVLAIISLILLLLFFKKR
jgi:hypothetical protein